MMRILFSIFIVSFFASYEANSLGLTAVELVAELPVCGGSDQGPAIYVVETGRFHVCNVGTWTAVGAAKAAEWDSAYTERLQWDGGSTGLDTSNARTNLGLGTAATLDAGASVGNVLSLDGSGNMPAMAGTALTGLSGFDAASININRLSASSCAEGSLLTATNSAWQCETFTGRSDYWIRGLQLSWETDSTVRLSAGEATSLTGRKIVLPSDISIDRLFLGINGYDGTGGTAGSWYAVWLVSGSSGVGGLLSASSTDPTIPSGYDDQKRRVGWIRINISSNIERFVAASTNGSRFFSMTSTWIATTNTTNSTYTSINNLLPPGTTWARIGLRATGTGSTNAGHAAICCSLEAFWAESLSAATDYDTNTSDIEIKLNSGTRQLRVWVIGSTTGKEYRILGWYDDLH
jgi:hypothetical protein